YLAIAERFIAANQLVLDLLVNAAGDKNLARIGNVLDARSHIDAVAVNVVLFDDHVAKVDADPILDPLVSRQDCVAPGHVLLNDDRTSHRLERAVENGDEAVARGLDEPAVVLGDAGFDEIALDPLHTDVCTFFIVLHEAAVASDITSDDC